jgi:uncharacterized Zn finger protein
MTPKTSSAPAEPGKAPKPKARRSRRKVIEIEELRPEELEAKEGASAQRGIKVRKIGATWWGQRWIEALEHLSRDYLNRLGRGRAYARAGHVIDMRVAPGTVTAVVTGPDLDSYDVTIRIAMLPPALWTKAIEAMSKQAKFGAELLTGRMPTDIEEAFRAAGHSLFLARQRELETDCSCSDWANPCKHVAAVHYVLGEAFDHDPFLLFELRGRTRQQLLGALRNLRAGGGRNGADGTQSAKATLKNADVLLEKLAAASARKSVTTVAADASAMRVNEADWQADFERLRAPLPALQFHVAEPAVPGAVLKQLGPPPSWPDDEKFEALAEVYAKAGNLAREWALGSPQALQDMQVGTDAGVHEKRKASGKR